MKFTISTKDGRARRGAKLGRVDSIPWTENDMRYLLGLNPQLLGVENDLPVDRDGGRDQGGSDQLYVDEHGRATIIAIQRDAADLEAVAQLLSYADHERQLPSGELERRYVWARYGWPEPWRDRALGRIGALASKRKGRAVRPPRMPPHDETRSSFEELAYERFGPGALSLRGTSPKLWLVAGDTSKCEDLVRLLQARHVNIRTAEAELGRTADGKLVLTWKPGPVLPELDALWSASGYLWTDEFLRANFEPNGWAEPRPEGGISFSARRAGRVRFYLTVSSEGDVILDTSLPEGWCKDKEKLQQTRALKRRLPAKVNQYTFVLPSERARLVSIASEVGRVLLETLVPEPVVEEEPSVEPEPALQAAAAEEAVVEAPPAEEPPAEEPSIPESDAIVEPDFDESLPEDDE